MTNDGTNIITPLIVVNHSHVLTVLTHDRLRHIPSLQDLIGSHREGKHACLTAITTFTTTASLITMLSATSEGIVSFFLADANAAYSFCMTSSEGDAYWWGGSGGGGVREGWGEGGGEKDQTLIERGVALYFQHTGTRIMAAWVS